MALYALVLGSIQALAMTYQLGGVVTASLQIASLSAFVYWITSQKKVFFMSWLFATSWLLGSVAWLYVALHVHGHMPSWLSILAIIFLCGGLALYYSSTVWAYTRLQKKINPWVAVMLFAASWTLAEMARAQWFTGFPWAAIGYAQVDGYLSFAAPLVGVYGVGFLAACVSATMALAWRQDSKLFKIMVLLSLCALLIPADREQPKDTKTISVSLLQANISQDLKFASGKSEALNWYKQELMRSESDLTVLPETAVPYFKADLPASFWQDIEQKFEQKNQAAIIGIPTQNKQAGYGNSAIALGMTGGPVQYDKHHLVPFGEFTPESLKWFNQLVNFGMTDFIRGSIHPEPFEWQQHHLSVNICYEDLFGEELAKRFVMGASKSPDILVNISNLGWFGDNYVVDQHLQIARMRSLEFNRPSVRATNSGGTAIINAQGEITSKLQPYTRGVLTGQVGMQSTGITPFAQWAGRWGLKPLWGTCLAIYLIALCQYKWRTRKRMVAAQ